MKRFYSRCIIFGAFLMMVSGCGSKTPEKSGEPGNVVLSCLDAIRLSKSKTVRESVVVDGAYEAEAIARRVENFGLNMVEWLYDTKSFHVKDVTIYGNTAIVKIVAEFVDGTEDEKDIPLRKENEHWYIVLKEQDD